MSKWCLLLREHVAALRYAGPRARDVGLDGCVACRLAQSAKIEGYQLPQLADANVYVCCSCLQGWHDVCAQNPMFGPWELANRAVAAGASMFDTVHFVCPVCTGESRFRTSMPRA